ncbi:MAG: hypothetical protein KGL46_05380 [Hyphomicrobiales bacterium]|nr:hypothetical protein [Hyphomicrobiales bacterium]
MSLPHATIEAPSRPAASGLAASARFPLAFLGALALGQLGNLALIGSIWRNNNFGDTDDATRLVQVRNLMAGQGWFDMSEYRLDPPAGVFSHWSRIVDIPLVALTKAFGLFLSPDMAERAMRIAFPLLLTAALYWLVVRLGGALMQRASPLHMLGAGVASTPFYGQFVPGRIDHHAPQIVVLAAMALTIVLSFRKPAFAALAAACAALALAISLEGLPLIAVMGAAPLVAWIANGAHDDRARLGWFALGLAIALPAFYALTIAPARWLLTFVDALSFGYLCLALVGAAGFGALSLAPARTQRLRLGFAAALAVALAMVLVLGFPHLLHGPFGDVAPALRVKWLQTVTEVQPLWVAFADRPVTVLAAIVMPLAGLAGAARALAAAQPGAERAGWMVVVACLVVGLALSAAMNRTLYLLSPFAIPGVVFLALDLQRRAQKYPAAGDVAVFTLTLLCCAPPAVTAFAGALGGIFPAAPPTAAQTAAMQRGGSPQNCFSPSAWRALDALPPGLVFADVDLGPSALVYTRHAVLAAPYHRDGRGMLAVFAGMEASPAAAETILRDNHVAYVVACRAAPVETHGDLQAALAAGTAPHWLRKLALSAGALDVYAMAPGDIAKH